MISVEDDDDIGVFTVAIDDMDNDDGEDRISAISDDLGDGDDKSGGRSVGGIDVSEAKEADAAINNASAHSIGSMQSSISSVNPHNANQPSPQQGKAAASGGGSMSEQAARLGLYA